MRFCSIASGSSGNCIYVGTEDTHLLVDAGISGKRIEQGLNQLELTGNDIDAILVTHEHSDHVSGLGVMARRRLSVINLKYHFYTLFRQKEHFPKIDILIRTAYNKSIPSAFYPGTCLKKTILRSACPGK